MSWSAWITLKSGAYQEQKQVLDYLPYMSESEAEKGYGTANDYGNPKLSS